MIDTVFHINLTHLDKICEALSSLKMRGIFEGKTFGTMSTYPKNEIKHKQTESGTSCSTPRHTFTLRFLQSATCERLSFQRL